MIKDNEHDVQRSEQHLRIEAIQKLDNGEHPQLVLTSFALAARKLIVALSRHSPTLQYQCTPSITVVLKQVRFAHEDSSLPSLLA
ncbi:hypothetical protein M378DRAFT_166953 [Amanita muscaria Koide BX008]|uniref:Uncharacterized protein n=1 Tax=Amanita muscaria (strain Koide BX008) TaxID=946122 RepID=A0A0C2WXD4_AMAMK|nr:hypothetical protein M378DRAFT_166953 [Amanita muscaria Koide BX008]